MSERTRERLCRNVCVCVCVHGRGWGAHPAPGVLGGVWMSPAVQQEFPHPQSGWEWPGAAGEPPTCGLPAPGTESPL